MRIGIIGVSIFLFSYIECIHAWDWPSDRKVIYGEDNRIEAYEHLPSLQLSMSTAAMIEAKSLVMEGDRILIQGKSLREEIPLCSYERFAQQVSAAVCSGFLVGPDLLLTAGHCSPRNGKCNADFRWVFDYRLDSVNQTKIYVLASDVYNCAQIVEREESDDHDYALIRLDRAVAGRLPLALNTVGGLRKGAPLFMIGHPMGAPAKVTGGAAVRSTGSGAFFLANLDAYGGNSGSAVFNQKTGKVEGILVAGEIDFMTDTRNDCYYSKACTDDGCEGESVQKISDIRYFRTHP